LLQQHVTYPPYLPGDITFKAALWTTGTRKLYDDLYQAGINYDLLRQMYLVHARNAIKQNDISMAKRYLEDSLRYGGMSSDCFSAATEIALHGEEAAEKPIELFMKLVKLLLLASILASRFSVQAPRLLSVQFSVSVQLLNGPIQQLS